jgi:hypothetical protein
LVASAVASPAPPGPRKIAIYVSLQFTQDTE